jgi:hypothetical protein
MYRIEVKPGEENVYRTIEELATAIRNGLVTSRSRIFHNASQKWLPIEFHPHYKKALQLPKTNSGESPAIVVASPAGHQTHKTHEPSKSHEPVKPPQAAKPSEAPKPIEAPRATGVARPHQSAPKTRDLEIVYTPPASRSVAPQPLSQTVPRAETVSPVVELPTIDYPESSTVESLLPVASASKARSTSRHRPLVLGTAAAVLIAGTYVAISGAMPSHQAAADNRPIPAATETVSEPIHQLAVAPVDSSIRSPIVTASTPTNGPTFGPPAAPPPSPKRQIVSSIGATTPATAPASVRKDSVESIEPAPVDVDVSVPTAPSGDSLAPGVRTDSNAIGRILKAVSGKGSSSQP